MADCYCSECMTPQDHEPEFCSGCNQPIDPDVCHCGEPMDKHGYGAGHSPIPMGCDCGRSKE